MRRHSKRPAFLDLTKIRMPVGALTSILHRATGVILAASVPAAVYLFGLSIRDEQGFVRVTELFAQRAFKTLAVIVVWALAHHLLAGVRHMLTDLGVGSSLRVARGSGWLVNLAGVVLALLAARTMW